MLNHRIDTVVVGADGIIVNFNLINKVTTLPIVGITMKIEISFNEVALVSSAGLNLERSQDIYIDNMGIEEFKGYESKKWDPENVNFFNPTFGIMPAQYNCGSITRRGIIRFFAENNFEILSYEN